jgi:hypothetical protein
MLVLILIGLLGFRSSGLLLAIMAVLTFHTAWRRLVHVREQMHAQALSSSESEGH